MAASSNVARVVCRRTPELIVLARDALHGTLVEVASVLEDRNGKERGMEDSQGPNEMNGVQMRRVPQCCKPP